ncbi:nucleotidyltransferase domain-containing protein [Comamonas testosteroni]|nr:nucleotidyltransferase domain-containing protein [Comamonas testosteroni]
MVTVAKLLFFQAVGRARIPEADIHGLSFTGRARRRVSNMRASDPHCPERCRTPPTFSVPVASRKKSSIASTIGDNCKQHLVVGCCLPDGTRVNHCAILDPMKSCRDTAPTFIKALPVRPLQPEFINLIDDARDSVLQELGALLDSLYLFGSVPRAMDQPGKSDLDLTLVLSRPLSSQETESLERVRSNLEAGHPEVTKVDLDLGVLEDVLNPANLYSWGYWLKHECRCIYGSDLALRFQAFQPSPTVAQAVNGDYVQALRDYVARISLAHDEDATRRLKKEAAKKLVRATNVLRLEADCLWPESLEEYAKFFSGRFPEMAEQMEFFLEHAKTPSATNNVFNQRLVFFVDWMQGLQCSSASA